MRDSWGILGLMMILVCFRQDSIQRYRRLPAGRGGIGAKCGNTASPAENPIHSDRPRKLPAGSEPNDAEAPNPTVSIAGRKSSQHPAGIGGSGEERADHAAPAENPADPFVGREHLGRKHSRKRRFRRQPLPQLAIHIHRAESELPASG